MRTATLTTCDHVAAQLSDAAAGGVDLEEAARAHVDHCLRCQAELAQYRKLFRALHSMRGELVAPAPGLVGEIFLALEEGGDRSALRGILTGRKVAYLGGIAAATAAGVGSALVVASRTRRRAS